MRKEVLFTIIAGAILGIVIAFGIWRANLSLSNNEEEIEKEVTSETKTTPTPSSEFGLTLAKPVNLQVITTTPSTISGITRPNTWVAISAEEEDYIFITDDKGEFNQDIDMIGGVNQIALFSLFENAPPFKEDLTLVFSTEFHSDNSSESNATDEAELIEERVDEKIDQASNKSQAYIGTITDILESSIQMKSSNDEIQQVSIDPEESTLVKVDKKTTNIEFSDLAIGDFIIAMGFPKENNGVLDAKRVVVTDSIEFTDKQAARGIIKEIGNENLTIETADKVEKRVEVPKGVTITRQEDDEVENIRFKNLEEGDTIITVGITVGDSNIEARSIHVIGQTEPSPSPTPESEEPTDNEAGE